VTGTGPAADAADSPGDDVKWRAGRPRRRILVAEVDPRRVRDNYVRRAPLERIRFYGASLGLPWYRRRGGWDLRCQPFEEHPTFRFLQDFYRSGFDPAATGRYQELLRRARASRDDENRAQEAVAGYFERRRALFESMARDGYRAGMARDEIGIAIGRDGRLIKTANGNHRMAVAQLLGLEEVTVELRYVHERWYQCQVPRTSEGFRQRIASVVRTLPGVRELSLG